MKQRTAPLNLLDHINPAPGALGAPLWAKALFVVAAFGMAAGLVFTTRLVLSVSHAFSSATVPSGGQLLHRLQQLMVPPEKYIRGEEHDQVNILLLGMGGAGHEGPLLTDTMMVASIRPSTGRVGLLSIPRDLLVRIPDDDYRKINAANALGENPDRPGSGAELARTVVSQVIGAPIHYFVRVDFGGFAKLINNLGGVAVTVDTAFVDAAYPTEDFGYQTIRFAAGPQQMNGDAALRFVRSRHGTDGEGSDFARAARQQKVLLALKQKVFSAQTLLNPAAIANILTTLGTHVQTDFEPWEILKLARLGAIVDRDHITHVVLDTSATGYLRTETGVDGAYLLVPKEGVGKYEEIQRAFAAMTEQDLPAAPARVEVQNGTTAAGLAAQVAARLSDPSLTVVSVRNAAQRQVEHTVIYDLSNGKQTAALQALRTLLTAEVVTGLPALFTPTNTDVGLSDLSASLSNSGTLRTLQTDSSLQDMDIVVVLGRDDAPSPAAALP